MASDLPCDGDGACMVCKAAPPPEEELLRCRTCATPWHAPCLSRPPESLAAAAEWSCPDCSGDHAPAAAAGAATGAGSELVAAIRAIEADESLSEQEKARRRQALLGRGAADAAAGDSSDDDDEEKEKGEDDVMEVIRKMFSCGVCTFVPERPVTTPCGHNYCLKCFTKWINQGKHNCTKCRTAIPSKMASQPRINSALVEAIRMARIAKGANSVGSTNVYQYIRNDNRPDKAFTTERAKRAGKANACCGQIFVTVAPDHFGPILAENDPRRNLGVRVGELWEDRLECRQWGAHLPHVAGIAGQSDYGAQSVALSGGYEDDEDHGEWFLYTGSGGRDLSGNKRTNKEHSFDQKFEKSNAALRVSCLKGYPVRVVRSHKEKRSSYAPESGVRYDGIYRIEKCWRKVGTQGFKVCRYLFVRCDNEPAPWTSDDHGDHPRPLPKITELKKATDITERKEGAAWDYDEKTGWKWMKPPPVSRKPILTGNPDDKKRVRRARLAQNMSVRERLLKEFSCSICRNVMKEPLTTPCGHNFCKQCLLGSYANRSHMRERTREGGRTLRAQKIVKKCPSCPTDICDFLQNPHVNRELMDLIESLQKQSEEEAKGLDGSDATDKSGEDGCDVSEEKQQSDDTSLNKEESDGAENKKIESVDGDSDVNADGAEKREIDNKERTQPSRKRKGSAVSGQGGKRTKKNAEVNDGGAEAKKFEMETDGEKEALVVVEGDKDSEVADAESPSSL